MSARGHTGMTKRRQQLLTKEQRKAKAREKESRVREALDQARAEQARLEARIAREKEQPAVGAVPGAQYHPPEPEPEPVIPQQRKPRRTPLPAKDAEGTWNLGSARSLIRAGYHIHHVQRLTGWGAKWFDDMALDADGYGLPIIEEDE